MSHSDFEEFAARELPGLLRYAAMLTGDRELAQDLVQDVMVKAHDQWRRVAAADHPGRYARAMVTRAFLSWRRRWAVRTILLAADGAPDGTPTRDHSVDVVDRDTSYAIASASSPADKPARRSIQVVATPQSWGEPQGKPRPAAAAGTPVQGRPTWVFTHRDRAEPVGRRDPPGRVGRAVLHRTGHHARRAVPDRRRHPLDRLTGTERISSPRRHGPPGGESPSWGGSRPDPRTTP